MAIPGLPPVVYIAGPYRASSAWEVEQNIRAAEEMALRVWLAGGAALCPHTNTRFFDGAAPDGVWLLGDLAFLAKCDAILMLPTWERSTGARNERDFAVSRNIPVFYDFETFEVWVAERKVWTV